MRTTDAGHDDEGNADISTGPFLNLVARATRPLGAGRKRGAKKEEFRIWRNFLNRRKKEENFERLL